MTSNFHTRQGLVRKQTLTTTDITEIRQLADLCNQYEQLHMRISWVALRSRAGNEYHDLLYYQDDQLVGYLSLDSAGGSERELTGMVHPAYRRRGIFTTLFRATQEDCARLSIPHVILVCERSSVPGRAFVQSVNASLELSEHEMWLANFQERGTFDDRVSFAQATLDDMDALITVQAQSFGVPEILSRQSLLHRFADPTCRIFLATFGEPSVGCHEPLGLLRLQEEDDVIGIYGFGLIPDYRGRGYGRQMLEEAIRLVRSESEKPIMLDVDTTNTVALGLYLSCGFVIRTTYDYSHVATS
ncbi:MAG TPA: GNAT family N-acetyltransferase [Ktedonobacteraceae bacterium]|nr:GNAT family N-acetyltransferase [Ktedonobacteraceae bacterium]